MRNLTLASLALLIPAFALAQEQTPKFYDLAIVAERYDSLPQEMSAIHEYVKAQAKFARAEVAAASAQASSACTSEFLGSAPRVDVVVQRTMVYFFTGCGFSAGTWFIAEWNYPDGSGSVIYQRLNQDISANAIFTWLPDPAPTPAGGTFTLTILPTNSLWRVYSTTFEAAVPLQYADEVPSFAPNGTYHRVIAIKGIYDGGLRAFYGYTDITKRAVFVARDTVQFDVSDIFLREGVYYPITVVQGVGQCQTLLMYYASTPGKG